MATYDYIDETDEQYFGTDFPAAGLARMFVVQRTVNFETACTDLKSGEDFAQNDVIKLIDVPANTWVLAVAVRVTTASDTADDVDIGDGDDTDGWIDGLDMTSTSNKGFAGVSGTDGGGAFSVATAGGKWYTSADTIDLKFTGASGVDDGVFEITAIMMDIS